jgi:hypothetical protein
MAEFLLCENALKEKDFKSIENFYRIQQPIWVLNDNTIHEDLSKDLHFTIVDYPDSFLYKENIQFVSAIVSDRKLLFENNIHKIFSPLIFKIQELVGNEIDIIRAKINYVPAMINGIKGINYFNTPHIDQMNNYSDVYSAIFYLNDSTGGTIFFNEKYNGPEDTDFFWKNITRKLSTNVYFTSLKNRLIIFKNDIIHTGFSTNIDNKVLMNINFTIRK